MSVLLTIRVLHLAQYLYKGSMNEYMVAIRKKRRTTKRDKYVAVVYQLRFCQRKESFDFDIVFK